MTFTEDEIKQFMLNLGDLIPAVAIERVAFVLKAHDKRLIERFVGDYMTHINIVEPESSKFIKKVSKTLNEYLKRAKPLEVTK